MQKSNSGQFFAEPRLDLELYTRAPLITSLEFAQIDPATQLENFESSLTDSPAELANFIATMVFFLMTGMNKNASAIANNQIAFKSFVQDAIMATGVSEYAIVLSLKYIAVLKQKLNFQPNGSVEYRVWVTSLMIADTFLNDNAYTCKSWAKVTNLPAAECATMRREFLEALDYRICVNEKEYGEWLNQLEKYMSMLVNTSTEHIASPPLAQVEYQGVSRKHFPRRPSQSNPYPIRINQSVINSTLRPIQRISISSPHSSVQLSPSVLASHQIPSSAFPITAAQTAVIQPNLVANPQFILPSNIPNTGQFSHPATTLMLASRMVQVPQTSPANLLATPNQMMSLYLQQQQILRNQGLAPRVRSRPTTPENGVNRNYRSSQNIQPFPKKSS